IFPDLVMGRSDLPADINSFGILAALGASGIVAVSTAITRRIMPEGDPIALIGLAALAASPLMFAESMLAGGLGSVAQMPGSLIPVLVFIGVGCTAVNVALWSYSMKYLSAARVSVITYSIAPGGVILSAIFVGEPLTAALAIGTALIVGGILLAQ